jgi:protein TonB
MNLARAIAGAMCVLALTAGQAPAAQKSPEPPAPIKPAAPATLARPNWIKSPTLDEKVAAWPKAAMSRGTEGGAILDCRVTQAGGLADCNVQQETPADQGFGVAALRLAGKYQMRMGQDGSPKPRERVLVPVLFEVPR